MRMTDSIWRDLKLAARTLVKAKSVTIAVVATLAIGIGATTLVFSIVNGVLLKPLPYPEPERLVVLNHAAPGIDLPDITSAPFLHFVYQEQSETLAGSGLWNAQAAAVTSTPNPERVTTIGVTAGVLPLLEIQPAVGRLFGAADEEPEAPLITVLTYGYWQRTFGGDPAALGQRLTIDGRDHEIIGVMPQGFRFLDEDTDLFVPLQFDRAQTMLGLFNYDGIARLKPGVSLETLSAEMAHLIPIAVEAFPPFPGTSREMFREANITPNLRSLKSAVVGDVETTLWVVMGTIGMVLLIACANVANLFLIRTEGRRRELAIRTALGAGRAQIARLVLLESLLLGVAGGAAGLGLAYGGLEFVLGQGPANLPRLEDIAIDANVLAFAAVMAPLTGLVFGMVPALRLAGTRFSSALGAAGRTVSEGRGEQRLHGGLVVVQVSLALVLMIASGLMLRSFQALSEVDPGFTGADAVQTVRINIPPQRIPEVERATRAMQQIVESVAAIPGVDSAAFGSSVPLEDFQMTNPLFAEGVGYEENELPPMRRFKFASPGFFSTIGVPLVAGRDLTWTDYFDRRPVAIVSEALAREEWGSAEAALGEHVRPSPEDDWREVVGVAGDVRENGLAEEAPATAYFPMLLERFMGFPEFLWRPATLVVRTPRAGTEAFVRELSEAVWRVDGSLPVANARTLESLYEASFARTSFTLVLLGVAGAMALLLSLIGIYGVVAYAVSRRTREIGVRLALGASANGVRSLFWWQALRLVAAGIAAGLVAAFGLTRLIESLLFGVAPLDASTFVVVPALMLAVAALASLVPARRALRIDPMDALRDE
jgi:putative ABC transport system permease protein